MRLLIDADLVGFRCAASAEQEDEPIARLRVNELVDRLLVETGADSYQLYLTGQNNFRYEIYPEYKGNRHDMYRPRHLGACRQLLIDQGATVSDGCEADDLLGVEQCTSSDDTMIASLDKDLLMIPGKHYSWEITGVSGGKRWTKEAVSRDVTEHDALQWFYTQVLTGDVADNIKGAAGVGKVGAARILSGCRTEAEYLAAVRGHFSCDEELEMNAACLWIWRKPNDIWRLEDHDAG